MRDPALYTPEKCWTAAESQLADRTLAALRRQPTMTLDEVVLELGAVCTEAERADIAHVAERLREFPHIFEVAKARGEMDAYDCRVRCVSNVSIA